MVTRFACAAVLIALVLHGGNSAAADPAEATFAKGKALLASADFEGAMTAFSQAAQADRSNQEYLRYFAMVRRVIALREGLGTEQDESRWEYMARGLYKFYTSQKLHAEALAIAKKMHARLNTASTARMLADTQLDSNLNAEAAATLASLKSSQQTVATRALRGLALARQGQADEARRIADGLSPGKGAGREMIYAVARLNAAVGNDEAAAGFLARSFEATAPSHLPAFKNRARQCPDFAQLVSTATFAEALETESKISESKCSGGTGCGNCPMRGKCGKSQGQ